MLKINEDKSSKNVSHHATLYLGIARLLLVSSMCRPVPQDEHYLHLTAEEMSAVEKCVSESMVWMNSRMNAQSKLGLTQDPVVKVADVISKIQVSRWQ